MSRYVTWYVGEMPRNANSFQWEFPPCWNRMSWKQSAGHISERLVGKQIESCTLASKKWGALEALLQMTPIGAASVCCKASDIVAEDALSIADIKWGTFMRPRSRYVTWYVGEMPWSANLFQWEFPACWNRMSWKQSAGHISERLVGKQIESCTLASKKWALEAPWQMTPSRVAFVCPSWWWSIMNSIRSTVPFEHEIQGARVRSVASGQNCYTIYMIEFHCLYWYHFNRCSDCKKV